MSKGRHPSHLFAWEHFNEPVIDFLSVVRLVGWGQGEDDAYYILSAPRKPLVRSSVVGWLFPLRHMKNEGTLVGADGKEWSHFARMDEWLALNGAPKVEEFILEETEGAR